MTWCYEIRGSENRLVEVRSGFPSKQQASDAGKRAKRMIDCICYPNFETLSLVVRDADTVPEHLPDGPTAAESWRLLSKSEVGFEVKYSWQQQVVEAFLEPHPENVPGKIAAAERALSRRLLDPEPFQIDERLAIGEALLAMRRLLQDLTDSASMDDTDETEGIA